MGGGGRGVGAPEPAAGRRRAPARRVHRARRHRDRQRRGAGRADGLPGPHRRHGRRDQAPHRARPARRRAAAARHPRAAAPGGPGRRYRPSSGNSTAELDRVAAGLAGTLEELREYARGIHPAILADGGLAPALKTLARRSPIPVTLDVRMPGRLPERVEVTAYYVISEALANAAKHAGASAVHVERRGGRRGHPAYRPRRRNRRRRPGARRLTAPVEPTWHRRNGGARPCGARRGAAVGW